MGLSDDQRAMLRLLAQREQGYEDIAALMGLTVDEVRARVSDALAQLEDEGVAPPAVPEEPPAPQPPAPEPPAPEPVAGPGPEPTPEPAAPRQPEPAPELSPEPGPEGVPQASAPRAPATKRSPGRARVPLPSEPGPRAAIAAGLVVLVALVVVLIVSGGGGGSTTTAAPETAPSEASAAAAGTAAANSKKVTKAVLESVDGSGASGVAIFGRVKNKLALQVEAEGLEPVAKGQAYTIWLAQSPQKMLPLASIDEVKEGRIGAQFYVPTEVLAYLANETFDQIAVTLTSDSALEASLKKATSEERAPAYTGSEVLRGTVVGPIVGAAKREKSE